MTLDRKRKEYRQHVLVAGIRNGIVEGRIYKDGEVMHISEGTSIDTMLDFLMSHVDESINQIAEQRETAPPNGYEYVRAFQKFIDTLSPGYCAMLKAHFHADNQEITATELADAAGYENFNAANLHYGLLGQRLNEHLPIKLPHGSDGKPIATYALATAPDQKGDQEHWVWKLRPGVAYAIEQLGLHV